MMIMKKNMKHKKLMIIITIRHRRYYHAPIRISYESMQSILEIRNQSLMVIDSCHKSQYNSIMMIQRQRQRLLRQHDT